MKKKRRKLLTHLLFEAIRIARERLIEIEVENSKRE